MEDSSKAKLSKLWTNSNGDLVSKLDTLKVGLRKWAWRIANENGLKEALSRKLEKLIVEEQSDENLSELIDTRIQLNWEVEKDEAYWEQRARVNWLKAGNKKISFFS